MGTQAKGAIKTVKVTAAQQKKRYVNFLRDKLFWPNKKKKKGIVQK